VQVRGPHFQPSQPAGLAGQLGGTYPPRANPAIPAGWLRRPSEAIHTHRVPPSPEVRYARSGRLFIAYTRTARPAKPRGDHWPLLPPRSRSGMAAVQPVHGSAGFVSPTDSARSTWDRPVRRHGSRDHPRRRHGRHPGRHGRRRHGTGGLDRRGRGWAHLHPVRGHVPSASGCARAHRHLSPSAVSPRLSGRVLDGATRMDPERVRRALGQRPVAVRTIAPDLADDAAFRSWYARLQRYSASPGSAIAWYRLSAEIDVRPALPSIRVPTLVIHRVGDMIVPVEHGRYLAAHIPGAKYVELQGSDHFWFDADSDAILAEVQEFITGVRPFPVPDRVLLTVLVTDVVDSTRLAPSWGPPVARPPRTAPPPRPGSVGTVWRS
jgi:hypothetical protein